MFGKKEFSSSVDSIVVGLGNFGREYEMTRHNAGFMVLDRLAEKQQVKLDRIKFKGLCNTCELAGKKVLLLKPTTYMNLSGQSVVEAMQFYKVPIERVIVVCDDVMQDVGKLRIRRKGSDGGQNGLKNIIYLTGSDAFPRVRVGVGKKPHPDYNLADWVLSRFHADELKKLQTAVEHAVESVPLLVQGNIDEAMNLYNTK